MAKKQQPKGFQTIVVETFSEPGYYLNQMRKDKPTAMNRSVNVRRYRITAEMIDEPTEVIAARIQHLWDECDNWQSWQALKSAAAEIGYTLQGDPGNKIKK